MSSCIQIDSSEDESIWEYKSLPKRHRSSQHGAVKREKDRVVNVTNSGASGGSRTWIDEVQENQVSRLTKTRKKREGRPTSRRSSKNIGKSQDDRRISPDLKTGSVSSTKLSTQVSGKTPRPLADTQTVVNKYNTILSQRSQPACMTSTNRLVRSAENASGHDSLHSCVSDGDMVEERNLQLPHDSSHSSSDCTDTTGCCPMCQLPFMALPRPQEAVHHVAQCLEDPPSALTECPDGNSCQSLEHKHYRLFQHLTLAKLKAGQRGPVWHSNSGLQAGVDIICERKNGELSSPDRLSWALGSRPVTSPGSDQGHVGGGGEPDNNLSADDDSRDLSDMLTDALSDEVLVDGMAREGQQKSSEKMTLRKPDVYVVLSSDDEDTFPRSTGKGSELNGLIQKTPEKLETGEKCSFFKLSQSSQKKREEMSSSQKKKTVKRKSSIKPDIENEEPGTPVKSRRSLDLNSSKEGVAQTAATSATKSQRRNRSSVCESKQSKQPKVTSFFKQKMLTLNQRQAKSLSEAADKKSISHSKIHHSIDSAHGSECNIDSAHVSECNIDSADVSESNIDNAHVSGCNKDGANIAGSKRDRTHDLHNDLPLHAERNTNSNTETVQDQIVTLQGADSHQTVSCDVDALQKIRHIENARNKEDPATLSCGDERETDDCDVDVPDTARSLYSSAGVHTEATLAAADDGDSNSLDSISDWASRVTKRVTDALIFPSDSEQIQADDVPVLSDGGFIIEDHQDLLMAGETTGPECTAGETTDPGCTAAVADSCDEDMSTVTLDVCQTSSAHSATVTEGRQLNRNACDILMANSRKGGALKKSVSETQPRQAALKRNASDILMGNRGHQEDKKQQGYQQTAATSHTSNAEYKPDRRCPFYKKIPDTPFTVDAFRYGEIQGCRAYFLSHFHYDHYCGLRKSFKQTIYCSQVTGNLVRSKIGVDARYICSLPLNTPTVVEGVEVTFLEANHCPGSVLILFRLKSGRILLHTGDFRACPDMELLPALTGLRINTLYLDTTYCDPTYSFPPQDEVISFAVGLVEKARKNNPKTLIVCGSYTIGKERVFTAIAEALNCRICVTREKKSVLDCLEDAELRQRVSLDWSHSGLHVLPMNKLNHKGLQEHLMRHGSSYRSVLALEPTGWTFSKKLISLEQIKPKLSHDGITIYGVPYSEHSSYLELKRFVQHFQPDKILPTVNNGNVHSRRKMEVIFEAWMEEARHGVNRASAHQQPSVSSWMHS